MDCNQWSVTDVRINLVVVVGIVVIISSSVIIVVVSKSLNVCDGLFLALVVVFTVVVIVVFFAMGFHRLELSVMNHTGRHVCSVQ